MQWAGAEYGLKSFFSRDFNSVTKSSSRYLEMETEEKWFSYPRDITNAIKAKTHTPPELDIVSSLESREMIKRKMKDF